MNTRRVRHGVTLLAGCAAVLPLPAAPRDPTVPPPALRAPSAPVSPAMRPEPPAAPRQLLTIDGRRYVVDRGRLRGVGDPLGDARIERIDDDAVHVRQAGVLLRLPMYATTVRREPSAAPPAPAVPSTAPGPVAERALASAAASPRAAVGTRPEAPDPETRPVP
ncbi:MAG: hypothetical protein MUF03_01980 [Rubrivivax sp.]|jgi:hypothetical protein|nr:hypothetical protein [Rubrivivax sp.]